MEISNLEPLTVEEQQHVTGGINWGCFASGACIAGGIITGQVEFIAYGIFGAYVNC
jgi:hypothetical protein